MQYDEHNIQKDSAAWIGFVKLSFGISLASMVIGIIMLPVNNWLKAFLGMGLWFIVGSTITLTKTMRDHHESQRLINRVNHAKTEKIITEYAA